MAKAAAMDGAYGAIYKRILAPLVAVLIVASIFKDVFDVAAAEQVTLAAAMLLVVCSAPSFAFITRVLFAVALALVVFILASGMPNAEAVLRVGIGSGAFMGAFFASLGILRFVSQTSPAILRCGAMLVSRPGSQRYTALTLGALMFSGVLNFGSVVLLGSMVRDAVDRRETDPARRLEGLRSMLVAILRGFSGGLMTAPTAFSFAVVMAGVPGVTWWALLPLAFATALLFLFTGWVVERFTVRGAPPAETAGNGDGLWAVLPALFVVAVVLGGAVLVEILTDSTLTQGLLLALPVIALCWQLLQVRRKPSRRAVLRDRARVLAREDLPRAGPEVVMVMLIGTIASLTGAIVAVYLPTGGMSGPMLPVPVVIFGLITVVALAGQVGLSPLIGVSVLTGVLPAAESLGLAPAVLAQTLLCAWGMSVGWGIGGAVVHITAALANTDLRTVVHRWNGLFSMLSVPVMTLFLWAVNTVLMG